jgi:aspartate kinase
MSRSTNQILSDEVNKFFPYLRWLIQSRIVMYKVFKFGGASVKDAESIRNVAKILRKYPNEKLLVVVSAMGKTTNRLEQLMQAYLKQSAETNSILKELRQSHLEVVKEFFPADHVVYDRLNDLWVTVEWILEEEPHPDENYIYDQIISVGELISSTILSHFLSLEGIKNSWLDARDVIVTDDIYREATVLWDRVEARCNEKVVPLFEETPIVLTQGFIGSTLDNNTTTLGREGSDYSAAIFAYVLDADGMWIWKDVPGILTADPKHFDHVSQISRLTYTEAIEMTYYGAKVIHPKTIKPIQNKHIPLYVKSFVDPEIDGTLISSLDELKLPPIVVLANHQAMLHISSKDFSFIGEHHLSRIFQLLAKHHLKINMMRNTAISFSVCLRYSERKINRFLEELGEDFSVTIDKDLELITIRHYNAQTVKEMKRNKVILFEERIRDTIQMVVAIAPVMRRK